MKAPLPLQEAMPRRIALPDFVVTQLLAASVYASFVKRTEGEECRVWTAMMQHEFDHAQYLEKLMTDAMEKTIRLPEARMEAYKESVQRAIEYMDLSAMERVELALRVEHAEIDYGFEGLLLGNCDLSPSPHYSGSVKEHYRTLMRHAERYSAAREIAGQMARLSEHFPDLMATPAEETEESTG